MLEAYEAFGDYETMMETVQSLIKHVAQTVVGKLVIPRNTKSMKSVIQSMILAVGTPTIPTDSTVSAAFQGWKQLEQEIGERSTAELAREAGVLLADAKSALELHIDNSQLGGIEKLTAKTELARFGDYLTDLAKTSESIDLSSWAKRRYKDLVREKVAEKTGGKFADWFALTPAERRRVAIEDLKMEGEIATGYEDFEVTGAVFEKLVEPTLIQPTFVTHLPKELVPLAKLSPDDPTTVEVFECCINGQEISPGYTEQNDPIAQRTTLEHQAGGEQQKLDEDFLVALEHGMPPAGGIGIGIDRLCMMLLGQESIRDVILFPQMKPK
jgi:lysyl-tRNA synthetase class 2